MSDEERKGAAEWRKGAMGREGRESGLDNSHTPHFLNLRLCIDLVVLRRAA